MHLLSRSTYLLALVLLLPGCATTMSNRRQAAERATADWRVTLVQVSEELTAGRYGAADRLLVQFRESHAGSVELADAAYYRALLKLDPANPQPAPAEARTLLDELLAEPVPSPRRLDALTLKRLSAAIEARPAAAASPAGAPASGAQSSQPPRTEELKAKDDEIARLKEEVARANAELERIKRRVVKP